MSSDKLPPSFNLLKSSKPGGLLGSFAVTAVVTTAATPTSSILRRQNSLDNKLNIKKVGDRLLAHAITASSFASSPLKLVPPGKGTFVRNFIIARLMFDIIYFYFY
jgi:hypothetical protein